MLIRVYIQNQLTPIINTFHAITPEVSFISFVQHPENLMINFFGRLTYQFLMLDFAIRLISGSLEICYSSQFDVLFGEDLQKTIEGSIQCGNRFTRFLFKHWRIWLCNPQNSINGSQSFSYYFQHLLDNSYYREL